MVDLSTPSNPSVWISTYADNLTIAPSHHKLDVAAENLQNYIHQLEESNQTLQTVDQAGAVVWQPGLVP